MILRISKSCLLTSSIELDTLSEESYKDSTLIMQLLRDNLVCSSNHHHLFYSTNLAVRRSGHLPKPIQPVRVALRRQNQRILVMHQQRSLKRHPSRAFSLFSEDWWLRGSDAGDIRTVSWWLDNPNKAALSL